MTNDERSPKSECRNGTGALFSAFGFRHSFVIRHSSFGIIATLGWSLSSTSPEPASNLRRIMENPPHPRRQVAKSGLVASGVCGFACHIADENPRNLLRMAAGQCAVDFRIALAGISYQNEAALGETHQQWLDDNRLVLLGAFKEREEALVLLAKV